MDSCSVTRADSTVTITLDHELYQTWIYAARYSTDGCMLEACVKEMTQPETKLELRSALGEIKVFFLTEDYVPWLDAVSLAPEKSESE